MAQYDLPQTKRVNLQTPPTPQFAGAPVTAVPPAQTPRISGDPRGLTAFIRETAAKYGVSPDVALRVAKSEGLNSFQSGVFNKGVQEPSFGAFQLYTGGGLGNQFQKDTGLDPSDPANEKATIDYALKHASTHGWGSWYGAKNTGIGEYEGISGRGDASGPPDPTPNVGSGESGYNVDSGTTTTTPDTEAKDSKKKKNSYGDAAGDGLADIGKIYAAAGNKTAATPASSTNVPAAVLPIPQGPIPMVDTKRAEAQRQMLAMAMQRLNSGRLS